MSINRCESGLVISSVAEVCKFESKKVHFCQIDLVASQPTPTSWRADSRHLPEQFNCGVTRRSTHRHQSPRNLKGCYPLAGTDTGLENSRVPQYRVETSLIAVGRRVPLPLLTLRSPRYLQAATLALPVDRSHAACVPEADHIIPEEQSI
ncbi:hypothetical protein J6590_008420 [Homalodisca vitripennis]|nr:hypothetical protein J6590_008420 [Homalodisca vitripennis]